MIGIAGERCVLTSIELKDLEIIQSWHSDPNVWKMTMGYRFPVTATGILAWYNKHIEDELSHSWAIRAMDSEVIRGLISLSGIEEISGVAELSVLVQGEPHGFGTDAVNTICLYAKRDLRLRKIWLRVRSENDRALRLYERTGFTQEGRLEKHYWVDGHFDDVLILAKFLNLET